MQKNQTLLLTGGSYLSPVTGAFTKGELLCSEGKIQSLGQEAANADIKIDCRGRYILPGLIDIHTHGALGVDSMSAEPQDYPKWASFLAGHGVTTVMPTSMSAEMPDILEMLKKVAKAAADPELPVSIAGVHIEGPYISPMQKGCHDERTIILPNTEDLSHYKKVIGNLRLRVTVAPELPGSMEFIEAAVKSGIEITIGHCDATSETVKEAIGRGANCFTHLFNAMRGVHHREPGTAGAALLSDAYTELICDGIHLHPDIIALTLRAKGIDKLITVTDAMPATGLEDGDYTFGGMPVKVIKGIARNPEGVLAGSTLTLDRAVKNLARFTGLPIEKAVLAATINPAKAAGLDEYVGSIEPEKQADLIVTDEEFHILHTISRGRLVYSA